MKRALFALVVGCGGSSSPMPPAADAPVTPTPDAAQPIAPLAVKSLGVQGFALQYGDDLVLTAPLFTRQSVFQVTINAPITIDTAGVDAGLAGLPLDKLRAVVSGHAHYD